VEESVWTLVDSSARNASSVRFAGIEGHHSASVLSQTARPSSGPTRRHPGEGYEACQGNVLRKHFTLRVVIQYEGCLRSTVSADQGESEPCRVCLRDGTSSRFASANTSTLA